MSMFWIITLTALISAICSEVGISLFATVVLCVIVYALNNCVREYIYGD